MSLGVSLKWLKKWAKIQIFAHRNILLGIFAPGAVPCSSALCLYFIVFKRVDTFTGHVRRAQSSAFGRIETRLRRAITQALRA